MVQALTDGCARHSGVSARAALLRSLAGAVLLAGVILAPSAAALPLLGHHGRWLTDPRGRVVILHGLQVDRFEPKVPIEYIDLNPANVRFMAAEGFNLARVSLAYAGVEPMIGHIDNGYVSSYVSFDRRLARAGIYDLLDMMQGQYSVKLDGWGFPDWMTVTGSAPNIGRPFPQGYFVNPAEDAAWDNFWADAPASDGVGLQQHYASGLRYLAGRFAQAPGLIGFEILNEPWPGSPWPTCASPTGCPAFDSSSLTGFYRRMIAALRLVDRRRLIAIEPNLLFDFGSASGLGALSDPNLLFAFHNYCLAYISSPGNEPSSVCAPDEKTTLTNAETQAQRSHQGLLMDEWGNTADTTTISRVAAEADQDAVGWSYWAYEDCCNSVGAVVRDGSKPPTAPGNLNLAVLNALVRPYPKLIAGTPEAWSYDPATDGFTLSYSTRPVGAGLRHRADTEIELPALRYATGYVVKVAGARVLSAPDANLLRLGNRPGAATVELTVTAADHHMRAPGPFAWPVTARAIAVADCPATLRRRLRILTRGRGLRLVRVRLDIDGRRVRVVRGRRIRWVTLPAGLADGTLVRLVASTSGGARRTTTRGLYGCMLRRRTWVVERTSARSARGPAPAARATRSAAAGRGRPAQTPSRPR